MRTYLYIGIGGFLGAVLRYLIKNWNFININSQFPLNIFLINILGCFVLALFLRIAFDIWKVDPDFRLGVSTGFIGALTTFSTFCRDIVSLILSGYVFLAVVNAILSIVVGILAIYFGDLIGKKLILIFRALKHD